VALRILPLKVLLASTSLNGEGGLILAEPYVPTLEERPAESKAVSSSVCLNTGTKLHLVPTPEERPAESSAVSSSVCLNTKATNPYLLHMVPTLEEPARKQCRFVPSVSKHQGSQSIWCPRPRKGLLKAVPFRPRCV